MRRALAVVSALLVIAVLVAFWFYRQVPRFDDVPEEVEVTVTASCTGNSISFGLDQWVVRVQPNGQVRWRITGPQIQQARITSKAAAGRPWPFDPATPELPWQGGGGGGPSGQVIGTEGQYYYGVRLICQPEGGAPMTVDIDPEIIITETGSAMTE